MKILKSTVIQAATIQVEDREEPYSENRYAVLCYLTETGAEPRVEKRL